MRYLLAIIALGFLVALHELGHLLGARLFGVEVERYSIGFGPPLFTFRRGGTRYTLAAVPLGGFVRIHGMAPHEDGADPGDPSSFVAQAAWKRALILAAGSLFNYLIALALLIVLYALGTHVPVPMTIGTVEPGSPAARAQLRPGDVVHAIEGRVPPAWTDLVETVNENPGRSLAFEIEREGQRLTVRVTPKADEGGAGHIGVAQQYVFRQFSVPAAFVQANRHAWSMLVDGVVLLSRLVRGRRGVELNTPVAIVKQASEAAQAGFETFARFVASISVALAVFNLLPFPALDGGRILFVGIEAITRRRVNPKLETTLHAIGFLLLIALFLAVAVRDVKRLLPSRAPAASADAGR